MNKYIAATFHGLEHVLQQELLELGAIDTEIMSRAVGFSADQEALYRLNLYAKTALRFLRPIHQFNAKDEKQLYDGVRSIDWKALFKGHKTILVRTSGKHNKITHSKYLAQLSKDGIVDRFRDDTGKRPNVETRHPNVIIQIHLRGDEVSVLLDSSGQSLFKRGYRQETGGAPINEVLASGLVALTEWNGDKTLIDVMCGSGTIPIEAAMRMSNLKTSRSDRIYAFQHWLDYDQSAYERLAREEEHVKEWRLAGSDINPEVLRMAKTNASCAGLGGLIKWKKQSFLDPKKELDNALIVMNPPYDERLPLEEARAFYQSIGDQLKRHCAGSEAWIFSGNLEALKFVGLKPSKKIKLYNGPLESRFMKYELY